MTLGERIVRELGSHGERGAYFDYGAYLALRGVDSIRELRVFLDQQGYDDVAESDDPAVVVENLRAYRLGADSTEERPLACRIAAWNFAVTLIIAWFNGVIWWAVSLGLKGDAATGMISGDRYYLGWKGGVYTEVTEAVFRYSLIHARVTWILFGVAFAALLGHLLVEAIHNARRRQEPPGSSP